MAEESTTPDLVELLRGNIEAANERDFDSTLSYLAPDAVWDMSAVGLGSYHGPDAIRRFFDDWLISYDEFEFEPEEILDFGRGVVLAVIRQSARPAGSTGQVHIRYAQLVVWAEGLIVRTEYYTDIDKARAAAERLAESRG
jgi:ketosteroid isomerase-like protein